MLDGQLFYSKKNKKLYIGEDEKPISELTGTQIGLNIENGTANGSIQSCEFSYVDDGSTKIATASANKEGAFAYGENCIASGLMSFAFGKNITVTSKRGVVFGNSNETHGNSGFTSGQTNRNFGICTTVIGKSNYSGNHSDVTFVNNLPSYSGDFNEALGAFSLIAGNKNINKANNNIIVGELNTISAGANNSAVFGQNNTCSGGYSNITGGQNTGVSYNIISGRSNSSAGSYSALFGQGNTSRGSHSFISGLNNKSQSSQSTILLGTGLQSTKADISYGHKILLGNYNEEVENSILEIGCGTSNEDRKTALVITKDYAQFNVPIKSLEDKISIKVNGQDPTSETIINFII